MTLTLPRLAWRTVLLASVLGLGLAQSSSQAAERQPTTPPKESDLIKILQSDASPAEKAITCKRLAIYGGKDAVPALAPLLIDPELTSWARIAIEAINDPSADDALRAAAPKAQGRVLVGIINSMGVRRDSKAVTQLAEKLKDSDTAVASAAAEALGHIGGSEAARALEAALSSQQAQVRSAAAYGCVLCSERLVADGKASDAAALCDKVRSANVPKQRQFEAVRGAILARGTAGIPLLVEQLKSPDMGFFSIGVRTARELPGREVTQAVARELDQANPDRQIPLLLALADRTDAAVMPKVLEVAERSPKALRMTALGLLDRYRDLACVPVLLNGATDNDAEIARIAKTILGRLGGKEVDADLLARLRLASGKMRQALLELAGQRRIQAAVPMVMQSTEDSDISVRRAALDAVTVLGTEQQVAGLVHMLSATPNADERDDIERALSGVCRRNGARCLPDVLPLAKTGDAALRKMGLRALSSIGGSEALGVVKGAMNDSDEGIRDEAVNLLSTWPNTWTEDSEVAEPLLALVKSARKPSYQVQALRGYLQYIEDTKSLSNEDKVTKLKEVLALTKGADEKRQVVSVAGTLPTPAALELLMGLAKDNEIAEEAYASAAKVASDRKLDKELRRTTLQTIVEKTQNEATKKKASDDLKRIR
jgi:HEAT repeat protein